MCYCSSSPNIRTNKRGEVGGTHQATFKNGVNEASIFCHNYRLEKASSLSANRALKAARCIAATMPGKRMKGVLPNPFMLMRLTRELTLSI